MPFWCRELEVSGQFFGLVREQLLREIAPCAVVPYKFEAPTRPVNGAVMEPGVDSAGVVGGPGVVYNPKPICAVLAGNLFNDDRILSVAHHFQTHTDWHTRHRKL